MKEPADDGEDEDMLELMDLEGRSVKPLAIPPGCLLKSHVDFVSLSPLIIIQEKVPRQW